MLSVVRDVAGTVANVIDSTCAMKGKSVDDPAIDLENRKDSTKVSTSC